MPQTYGFKKAEVLDKLHVNREQHHGIWEEALEGYRKEAIRVFESNIKKVKAGKIVSYVNLTQPVDHTKDYDRVIALLDMSIGETIELTEQQFSQYIQDDWDWKHQFLASNAYYSATASRMSEDDNDD